MLRFDRQGMHVGRRDFIKTTTMAGWLQPFRGTRFLVRVVLREALLNSRPDGTKKTVALSERLPVDLRKIPGVD